MNFMKKGLIALFLVFSFCSDVFADNVAELRNAVNTYLHSIITKDYSTYIKLCKTKDLEFYQNRDIAFLKNNFLNSPIVCGAYVTNLKVDGNEGLVDVRISSFRGHGDTTYKFVLEADGWKIDKGIELTDALFEKMKSVSYSSPEEASSVNKLAVLLLDMETFFRIKKRLTSFPVSIAPNTITYEKIARGYAKVILEIYTEKEIEAMYGFFSSQAGQKFLYTRENTAEKLLKLIIDTYRDNK